MSSPLSALLRIASYTVIFLLSFVATANAQFRAIVQGSVTDAHGAAVVGANIVLINKETNKTQQSASSDEGFYRFDRLSPGKYMLVVEHTGFKRKVLADVDVKAEEAQGINIQLEPGEIVETVTVSAEMSEQLKTENANIGKSITNREILRLPEYGRDTFELVRLAPGVFGLGARICCGFPLYLTLDSSFPGGSSKSIFASQNQPQITANGQRVAANYYELDGVNVTSQVYGGAAVITPNQESVKEVRVASSSYSAESGGYTGVLVQVVSQNGTNDFHGSAFFKYNDPALNAYAQWGGPHGERPTRDPKRDRQWGGSLGGPIYLPRFGESGRTLWTGKNKLFFFSSYETSRTRNKRYSYDWVETPEYRQLLREQRPGSIATTILSAPGMEPRIQSIIARNCASVGLNDPTKCATVPGGLDIGSLTGVIGQQVTNPTGGGLDGIPDLQFAQFLSPNHNKAQQINGRIDYQVTGKDLVAFSFYYTSVTATSTFSPRASDDYNWAQHNIAGVVLWNHTLSATTLNEARFNITRLSHDDLKANPQTLWGIPYVRVASFPFCCPHLELANSDATGSYQTSYNFRDALSKVVGRHGLKFGGEMAHEQNFDYWFFSAPRPSYDLGTLWNFANDAPIYEWGTFDPRTGVPTGSPNYMRANSYSFFVQDDWKVRPNLTLNLGLRWDYFAPLRDRSDHLSILILGTDQDALTDAKFRLGGPVYEPDLNNFGPQLGVAWTPQKIIGHMMRDKLVVRGGFGISYNRIPQHVVDGMRSNPPFGPEEFFLTGNQIVYSLGPTLHSYSGWPSNPNAISQFDPITNMPLTGFFFGAFGTMRHVPNPYTFRYSIGLQYDLGSAWIASLGYQGSASHELPRSKTFSLSRSDPQFNVRLLLTDVNANFNALLAGLTHRFSRAFALNAQYRWSKSIDNCSEDCWPQTYPVDQRTERGPSDFDVTHYFVASGLWDLPTPVKRRNFLDKILEGWQLNGILTASSGFPWTPIYKGGYITHPYTRPVAYLGELKQNTSNQAFMRPGGTFGTDASRFFVSAPKGAQTIPPPAIGRNVFRGPHYFSVDMSLVKRISLPKFARLGDAAVIDLRANFFNVFNNLNLARFNYGMPNTVITNRDFGRALQALSGRVVEFQARLSF